MRGQPKSFALQALKCAVLVAALLLLLPYLRGPIYDFPPPRPFSGARFLNPYDGLGNSWQRANLHAHGRAWGGLTNGVQTNQQVVRRYRAAGYSVPGVSNYHSIAALQGIDTIPLYEHGYNLGKHHQLAIGAHRVDWFDFPLFQWVSHQQFVIDRVARTADLVALAHPPSRGAYGPEDTRRLTGYQLLEILNGPFLSVESWDAALSSGRAVWAIGNDDTHDLEDPRRSMMAWTMINAPSASTKDVVAALRAGRAYAVARTNEIATAVDTTIADVQFVEGRLLVVIEGEPSTFTFVGQDGAVRKIVKNAMQADYTFAAADPYIRAVVRAPRTSMYLNPVIRHDGGGVPLLSSSVNAGLTWGWRVFAFCALAGGVLMFRRARRRLEAAEASARPVLARAKRKTA